MIRRFAFLPLLILAACSQKADDSESSTDAATATTPVSTAAISGADSFKKCAICHKVEKDAPNGVGPNLHGVSGKAVASVAGFNYSAAMKAKGGVWDDAALDALIENPRKAVMGTKMAFVGISDAAERKALIDYLKAQK